MSSFKDDPCYCEQACEYEALLESVLAVVPEGTLGDVRKDIKDAIARYKAALDEESGDDCKGCTTRMCTCLDSGEYEPKNERE